MVERSIADAVVLHLDALDDAGSGEDPGGADPEGPTEDATPADDPASLARTAPGTWAGLGIRAAATAERVAVLSALGDLAGEGLVETQVRAVAGLDGRRTVYALTDAGVERARELREDLADESVTVGGGDDRETVELGDIGRVVDGLPAGPPDSVRSPAGNGGGAGGSADGGPDVAVDPLAWAVANVSEGTLHVGPRRVGDGFVDRRIELGRLEGTLDAAAAGGARTVLVSGGPGVGTSSVLDAACGLARDRGFAVGTASAWGDEDPYGPVRRALATVAGRERVAEAFERHADRSVDDPTDLPSRRAAVYEAVAELLREVAGEGPVALAVDDLDAADRSTLALFAYLADRVRDAPVVLLGAYGDGAGTDDHPAEVFRDLSATWVSLDPLDGDGVVAMVARLVSDPDPPVDFLEAVGDRSGGNPLAVEGTVRRLVETGAVDPDRDRYPDREGVAALPADPGDLAAARVDDLPDPALEVLETAALLGERVPADLLVRAVDRPDPAVRDWIDLLVAAGFLVRPDPGTLRFAGGPVRAATRDRIPGDRRRERHGRIAAALDATGHYGPGTAAVHHERAGDTGVALERHLAAGEAARECYAHELAADRFDAAADLAREAGDDDALLAALEGLGDARRGLGEYDEALRHYAYVRERAEGETRRRAYRKSAGVHHATGDYGAAVDLARRGLEIAGASDGPADAETVELSLAKGAALLERGDPADAREDFERALSVAEDLGDPGLRGRAHNRLGTAALHLGDPGGAVESFTRAVESHRAADDPGTRATPLVNLGIVHRQLGDGERAIERFEAARAALEGAGDPAGLAGAIHEVGLTREARGETDAAVDRYEAAMTLADRVETHPVVARVAGDLGAAHQSLGEFDAAREHLERARSVAEAVGDSSTLAEACNALSQLATQQGDAEGAREHAESALSAARDAGDRAAIAYALAQVGERAREEGDHDRAVECHREGFGTADAVGADQVAVLNLVGLARDHLATGDADRAGEFADRAAESLGPASPASLRVALARIRADCARDRDDHDAAREHLSDALDDLAESDRPLRAQLLADLAEVASDRGEADRARDLARQARDLAADVGIEPVRERATDLLSDPA